MAKDTKTAEHVLETFLQPERIERIDDVLEGRTSGLTVVLDRVRNSHNISAVLRSADAFGVSKVHLVGDSFTYSPSISQGTERWMRMEQHQTAAEAISTLKKEGFELVILRPEEQSLAEGRTPYPVAQLPFERRLALVFGNEGLGVADEFSEAADLHAFIPMNGFVESLNISVACAICLFSSTISPATSTRRTPALNALERETLRDEWLKTGVKHSGLILKAIEARQNETES